MHLFECLMACACWIWANSALRGEVKVHGTLISCCSAAPWCSTVLVSFAKQTLTKNLVYFRKLYPFRRFWPPQFVFSYSYITAEDFCAYIRRFIDHKVCIACRKCSWKIMSKFLYLHEIRTPKMCTPPQILYSKWNITSGQNNVRFWHWYCTIVVTV